MTSATWPFERTVRKAGEVAFGLRAIGFAATAINVASQGCVAGSVCSIRRPRGAVRAVLRCRTTLQNRFQAADPASDHPLRHSLCSEGTRAAAATGDAAVRRDRERTRPGSDSLRTGILL